MTQPIIGPDDSADAIAEGLHDAKMRVAQLKGWLAFAKLRDGVKAPKAARKARAPRETHAANGAGAGVALPDDGAQA